MTTLNARITFRLPAAAVCAAAAALLLAAPAPAQTEPTAPTAGYLDPEGVPAREVFRDVDPVYRPPAIDTLATIRKRGFLRVGVALTDPMVMHDEQGELVGFSIDLARQLAEDLGVGLQLIETSWSHIVPDLLDRQFDVVLSGLWVTPERALVINFSEASAIEGIHLIASKALAANLKTREAYDSAGVRLAVYGGTVQERVARRLFPRATLLTVEGDDQQMDPVLDGRAHAALVATFAPRAIVRAAPDKLFLPFAEPLQATSAAAGVRKGDPDFLNYLDSLLTVYRDNGWLADRAAFWAEPQNWLK